jgi:Ser/Thr protein kinase RdoA (MazF antagonist)
MDISGILTSWNISNLPIRQIYISAWDIGDKYILKTGDNFNWLENNISIINALSKENIPVASIINTMDGLDYIVDNNKYFFLCKKIDGEHITNIYVDDYKELGYVIGEVIGRLHAAFRKCQQKMQCYDNNFYEEITGWVLQSFQHREAGKVPWTVLNECATLLNSIYSKLPRQLIHRDIHLGNMLFKNKLLTGYIDFDLSQINARIFDLCYMSLSLLVGVTADKAKTTKWFETLHSIVDGYNSMNPLTEIEKKAMPIMMIAIEMLFVAFFTSNNDEKNADEAETMLIWLWENRENIEANIPE